MATLWSETWAYADGTSPASMTLGYTGTGGATAVVQGSKFRLTSGGVSGAGKISRRAQMASVADSEHRGSFTLVSTTGDYTISVIARGDTALDGQNGYSIDVRNNGGTVTWQVVRANNYVYTTLLANGANNLTATNGTTVNYAFRLEGASVKAKLWTGATEPATWQYDDTDGAAYTTAGAVGFALSAVTGTLRQVDIGPVTISTPTTVTTVDAGPDQTGIEPGDTVVITATPSTATWAQTGGTPSVTLLQSGAIRTFRAPGTLNGTTLTFTATTGTDTSSMTVTVLPHNHWRFNASKVLVPRYPTNLRTATNTGGSTDPPVTPPATSTAIAMGVSTSDENHKFSQWNAIRTYRLSGAISESAQYGAQVIALSDDANAPVEGGAASATAVRNLLENFYYGTGSAARANIEIHYANGNEIDRDYSAGSLPSAYVTTTQLIADAVHTLNSNGTRRYPKASMWVDMTQNNIRTGGSGPRFKPIAPFLDGFACSMYPPGRQQDPVVWTPYATYCDEVFTTLADWKATNPGLTQFATWEFGIPIDHALKGMGEGGPTAQTNFTIRPRYVAGGIDSAGTNWTGFLQYVYNKCQGIGVTMREQIYWDQQSAADMPNQLFHDFAPLANPDTATAWHNWTPGSRLSNGTTSTPTTTWPNATNTGYAPTGVTLSPGPVATAVNFTTANQVIDGVNYNSDLVIRAAGVKFTRCNINGLVICNTDQYPGASVTLEDCTIDCGQQSRGAVAFSNLTIRRCNIRNGQHNVQGSENVLIEDSYLHDQYPGPGYHNNAFICNGGGNLTIRRNYLWCNATGNLPDPNTGGAGGATANLSLFGDFSPIHDVSITNNYIHSTPGGYGVTLGYNPSKPYGSSPSNVVFTDNTFQRGSSGVCGIYGPYTGFLNANGNLFARNAYEDGAAIP